jgi:hypothetical protein
MAIHTGIVYLLFLLFIILIVIQFFILIKIIKLAFNLSLSDVYIIYIYPILFYIKRKININKYFNLRGLITTLAIGLTLVFFKINFLPFLLIYLDIYLAHGIILFIGYLIKNIFLMFFDIYLYNIVLPSTRFSLRADSREGSPSSQDLNNDDLKGPFKDSEFVPDSDPSKPIKDMEHGELVVARNRAEFKRSLTGRFPSTSAEATRYWNTWNNRYTELQAEITRRIEGGAIINRNTVELFINRNRVELSALNLPSAALEYETPSDSGNRTDTESTGSKHNVTYTYIDNRKNIKGMPKPNSPAPSSSPMPGSTAGVICGSRSISEDSNTGSGNFFQPSDNVSEKSNSSKGKGPARSISSLSNDVFQTQDNISEKSKSSKGKGPARSISPFVNANDYVSSSENEEFSPKKKFSPDSNNGGPSSKKRKFN